MNRSWSMDYFYYLVIKANIHQKTMFFDNEHLMLWKTKIVLGKNFRSFFYITSQLSKKEGSDNYTQKYTK